MGEVVDDGENGVDEVVDRSGRRIWDRLDCLLDETRRYLPADLEVSDDSGPYPDIYGVAATTDDPDELADYSNNKSAHIKAQGDKVWGVRRSGMLTRWSGTSFAAAIATADIAHASAPIDVTEWRAATHVPAGEALQEHSVQATPSNP